ncbi:MAG: DNA polymerase IV [bacterium]
MMQAKVRERMLDDAPERRKPSPKSVKTAVSIIVHVDMDAFFAAIEERDNPALRGKPVIVGGPKGGRGVVTTANYVARKYGIHAGMSLMDAGRRCPNGIFVRTKGGKYTAVSLELMQTLRQFSPIVEPYSIDEAFLDGTGCAEYYGGAESYGRRIKETIRQRLNLTASVGIAPSRIVAKIASGLNKPDGLTIIPPEQVASVLWPLHIREVPGIGPATEKSLTALNVHTVRDLMECPESLLAHALGAHGRDLRALLCGSKPGIRDVVAMEERPDDKSMGHERTFGQDVTELAVLHRQLLYLCDRATRRMRKEDYVGRVVTLKLRLHDFKTFDHQRKLDSWTDDPLEIYRTARELLADLWRPGDPAVRLVGISVSGLIRQGDPLGVQTDLFDVRRTEARSKLLGAVDRLRDLYGEDIVEIAGGSRER